MDRSIPLTAVVILSMCGCSSSNDAPSGSDASTCDGGTCTGPTDASPGGDAPSPTGEGGVMPAGPNLCPGSGPVVPPLPAGVAVAYALGQGTDTIDSFLVSGPTLIWKDQKKIGRVNLNDGTSTTVIDRSNTGESEDQVGPMAIDATSIYFSDAISIFGSTPSLGIAKAPLTGAGAPTTIVNDPNGGLLAVADGYVYYEHHVTTGTIQSEIARVPVTGGTPTTLVRGIINGVRGLAVGGGYVYFFGTIGGFSYSSYYLARVPVTAQAPDVPDGGAVDDAGASDDAGVQPTGSELVATTGFDISGPVTDATNIYWGSDDKLMTVPLTGGTPAVIAQADPIDSMFAMTADVYGIVPNGGGVYWSSAGCQAIRKSPIDGGAATTVVPNASASSMAANSTHLYFAPTRTQVLSGPLSPAAP
jgi:hypothetical protein